VLTVLDDESAPDLVIDEGVAVAALQPRLQLLLGQLDRTHRLIDAHITQGHRHRYVNAI
jgi:hypothetical protein